MGVFQKIHTKWFYIALEVVFFVGIFILAIKPNDNADTFYHVKAGEVYFHHGLISKDVFSFATQGHESHPFEWLFQVLLYLFQKYFGYNAIPFFVAAITTLQIGIFYFFIKKVFSLSTFFTLFICFLYFSLSQEFFVARPQLLVLPIFIFIFFSILLYLKTKKNLLWITLPLTWMLANMHSSIVFVVYLFCSYTVVSLVLFFLSKDLNWKKKAETLGIYSVIVILVSILPPLFLTQYKLLLTFSHNFSVIQSVIYEWVPLYRYALPNLVYYLILCGIIPLFMYVVIKKRMFFDLILAAPLLIFILFPFQSYRTITTGYIALAVLLAWLISIINVSSLTIGRKRTIYFLCSILLIFFGSQFYLNKTHYKTAVFPVAATTFLMEHTLQGNMFNEFNQGAYILYRVYPTYQIFFDLQTDVNLCCELPKYKILLDNMSLPNDKFDNLITQTIFNPYNISFAIIPNKDDIQNLPSVLTDDPNWQLVYWDDIESIFVRKDGKNTEILKNFGVISASPFGKYPISSNDFSQAIKEYKRMIATTDSARSRNALGYIYIKQKKYAEAKKEFEKAIILDPTFDSPYANLAEIALYNKGSQQAIELYQKAKAINPLRAYTYLRLSQLYVQYLRDGQKAQDVLQEGLQNVSNDSDKQALQAALSRLQNM